MSEQAAEERVRVARIVAEHWRAALVAMAETFPHLSGMAHPLCMVLAALDGEADPVQLGVGEGADAEAIRG